MYNTVYSLVVASASQMLQLQNQSMHSYAAEVSC